MANYATLKAAINAVITANGNKEITGTVLNETLTAMVNSLGANYQFAGVATPSTNPGTPDQNVFYLAGKAGTYTNFNSMVLPNAVSILKWNGSWSSETIVGGDGVFDISAYKATGGTLATFANLSAALDGGNNIPSALRKGGMSVKFVQSSDNKYVQYFLTTDVWSAKPKDWEKINLEKEVNQIDFNLGGNLATPIQMEKGYIACGGSAGTVVNLTPIIQYNYTHAIITCSAGDVFYVQGKGGNSDRLYCWIDSENKVISSALSNQNQQTPLKIVAPSNAVKLIINDEESWRVSYQGERTCDKETYRQIKLVAFAASQSELNIGDIYYNTNERQIRCVTSQPSGYYIIPYYDGAIYTYNNIIYTWNGDTLVPVAKVSGNKLVLGGTHFDGIETDFVNINNLTNYPDAFPTRIDAYTAIPNAFRTLGMTVAYLLHYSSANVDKWEIEQYNGTSIDTSSWKDGSNWVKLNKGIEIVNNLTSGGTDKALSAEMGKVLSVNLSELEDKVGKTVYEEPIDINNAILKEGWYIDSNNVWRNNEQSYSCILVPIPQNGGYLRLVSGLLDCVYAFLAATYSYNYSRPSYAANTSRMTLAPNGSVEVKIPVDAQYLYLYKRGSSGSYLPVSVTRIVYPDMVIANLDKHITDIVNSVLSSNVQRSITSTGRDIPRNVGINNMYKKAHQMMDIPWTSLYNLPRVANSSIKVNAGDYLGFPYSSVKEKDKFVGFDVSYRTFMTAAHNPYSLLYTEDTFDGVRNDGTGAVGGISQYGFTYHGVNCGPYFGVVCNVFALLPLGFDIPWNTAEFDYLEYIGVLDKIEDQSASGVQVGDIIWETGHGNLITDIIRDSRGIPTQIYWSESAAMDGNKLIRTNIYTAAEFNQRLAMGHPTEQQSVGGIIYRIPEAYKNLSYTPSPFVAVEGEPTPSEWEYNDDICTFAGDYACFFEGDIIFLNYTKGNYTSLEIYKNDTLLSTKSLSADADVHKIDLTSDNLTYGKYKARLTDGSNHSDYTYWEIVDCNVTYANVSGDLKHITFDSHNGHPLYIAFVYQSGACRGMYKLTDADIKNGYVEICPRELLNDQYMRGSSSPALYLENVYVKVFFKGDYGTVRNEPILTDLYN